MRIVAWNIENGGATRHALQATALTRTNADVIVLSEYGRAASAPLTARLRAEGYLFGTDSGPPRLNDGVAIVSRLPVELRTLPCDADVAVLHRFLLVELKVGVKILGVYLPPKGDWLTLHASAWTALLENAAPLTAEPLLLAGDFNAGVHGSDWQATHGRSPASFGAPSFVRLLSLGWTDVWRTMHGDVEEYSYYSRRVRTSNRGFRIDHMLVSPAWRPPVQRVAYDQGVRERHLSTHAMLVADFDLSLG